jgi:hypothetical protein
MNLFFLLLSLLALFGCDSPQRSRAPVTYVNGSTIQDPYSYSNPGNLTTDSPTGNNTAAVSTGFENCDFSDKYQSVATGKFGICQSNQDETFFKFRPAVTMNVVKICLIPTYKDQTGASTYLGNPQCTFTTANQVVQGKLFKDRPGFSSYTINGVIVMPETLITEYISCMHSYINWPGNACQNASSTGYCRYWLPRCTSGSVTNQICMVEGRNYMSSVCNTFKIKYVNSYVDVRTKP